MMEEGLIVAGVSAEGVAADGSSGNDEHSADPQSLQQQQQQQDQQQQQQQPCRHHQPCHQVFVRDSTGRPMTFLLPRPAATVGGLRKAIAARTGLAGHRQVLTAGSGAVLDDDEASLGGDCGVGDGGEVGLSVRLRGGIDGTTIAVFAVLGLLGIFAIYILIKKTIQFSHWLWVNYVKRPYLWWYDNVATPFGHCCRWCIYRPKQNCVGCYDGCDQYYNPWKKMQIAG